MNRRQLLIVTMTLLGFAVYAVTLYLLLGGDTGPHPATASTAGQSGLPPAPCDTSAPGSYDGCTLVAYPGPADFGPELPDSFAGQPYNCRVMADTGECVNVFVRSPVTGWCTELFYIAPMAPGTDQGWRDENSSPAAYLCP